jgi:hypothetical protein
VIDLRPDCAMAYPEGIARFSFDPTSVISTPDQAVTVADMIMAMATAGLGSGADQDPDGGAWESQAEAPLVAALYAAIRLAR